MRNPFAATEDSAPQLARLAILILVLIGAWIEGVRAMRQPAATLDQIPNTAWGMLTQPLTRHRHPTSSSIPPAAREAVVRRLLHSRTGTTEGPGSDAPDTARTPSPPPARP